MLLNTFSCNKKENIVKNQDGAREHAELIIPLTGLLIKALNIKLRKVKEQRRANSSRIRFKTIHEIQIVFRRQFAFVSLKSLSPQKYIARMTRQWRMSLTTFFCQSENLLILKLNLWLKSTTSFFTRTLSLLNVLVSNLHLNYVDCKQPSHGHQKRNAF